MRKFYVLTGMCQRVVQARDAEAAAILAVHWFLDQFVDLDQIDWTDETQIDNADLFAALLKLGEDVQVSERGFGRREAGYFDTASIMNQWQQLVIAVSRMDLEFGN